MARNIGGQYQLACEASPNKLQIDTWLNEGKPIQWISDQLKAMGDYISTNSISKYKKYRDTMIREELEKEPQFIAKEQAATEIMNTYKNSKIIKEENDMYQTIVSREDMEKLFQNENNPEVQEKLRKLMEMKSVLE